MRTISAAILARQQQHSAPRGVSSVTGTPTFMYSMKPTGHCLRAASATIRLATEPTSVRLPASVEAIASARKARCGSGQLGTNGMNSITAGTFETRFDSAAAHGRSSAAAERASCACSSANSARSGRPPRAAPTTTNRPANSVQQVPVDLAGTPSRA